MIIVPNEFLKPNIQHIRSSGSTYLLSKIPFPIDYASIKRHLALLEALLSYCVFLTPDPGSDYLYDLSHCTEASGW